MELPVSHDLAYHFDGIWQLMSRKYNLAAETIKISNRDYRIYKATNPDFSFDKSQNSLPYWSAVWASSLALATYISEHSHLLNNTILELGCGPGLSGVVAGTFVENIVFTDKEPDALRLAEINWIVNHHYAANIDILDWQSPPQNVKFDHIIAADVAYEAAFYLPLLQTFDKLLSPKGEIWLSEPNRYVAKDFFSMLIENDFIYEKTSQKVISNSHEIMISIYVIRRK